MLLMSTNLARTGRYVDFVALFKLNLEFYLHSFIKKCEKRTAQNIKKIPREIYFKLYYIIYIIYFIIFIKVKYFFIVYIL